MVYFMENPLKMDDLGVPMGTPISGNLHIYHYLSPFHPSVPNRPPHWKLSKVRVQLTADAA